MAETPVTSLDKRQSPPGKRKVRPRRSKVNPRREMSFLEHLDELRGRLIICVGSIVLTTIIGIAFFANPAINLLTRPFTRLSKLPAQVLELYLQPDGTLQAPNLQDFLDGKISNKWMKIVVGRDGEGNEKSVVIGPGSSSGGLIATTLFAPIFLMFKAGIILGIVFAMPVWLHQIWLFVAPALTRAERKVVRPVLLSGIFLFPLGVLSAYGLLYVVMPVILQYGQMFPEVTLLPDIQKYISFELNLMLAFGIVFETPIVLIMIVRLGLISTRTLRKSRPYVVVIVFILAAIVTPTADPFTMIGTALPMLLLFEISLFIAARIERKIEAAERADAAAA